MFRTVVLSIIRSYSLYTQQWYMSYRFVDSFRAAVPSWSCCCSTAVYKPLWHIPLLSVQWITPDDGERNCPKHVEFYFQNKFEKLFHLVGFIIRKFITMHGHMNVKTLRSHWQQKKCSEIFKGHLLRGTTFVLSSSLTYFVIILFLNPPVKNETWMPFRCSFNCFVNENVYSWLLTIYAIL
jgi:hypothetical protein